MRNTLNSIKYRLNNYDFLYIEIEALAKGKTATIDISKC